MLITAVKVNNFKRIKQVELTLADVTVLIEVFREPSSLRLAALERRPLTAKTGV
jgi:hypothetical protein